MMAQHLKVFGTSHRLQGAEGRDFNIDDPDYSVLIERFLEDTDFVFEEGAEIGPTTAEKLALSKLGSGFYCDIDPSVERRLKEFGIGETGRSYPIHPCEPDSGILHYEFSLEQEKREALWLKRIQQWKFSRALLICGYTHVLSMSFRLRAAGYDVETTFYMPLAKLCPRLD